MYLQNVNILQQNHAAMQMLVSENSLQYATLLSDVTSVMLQCESLFTGTSLQRSNLPSNMGRTLRSRCKVGRDFRLLRPSSAISWLMYGVVGAALQTQHPDQHWHG